MNNVVAIVQPFELMSVAEQKYVIAEYAKEAGMTINQFVGEDGLLTKESPCLESLIQSILAGDTSGLLLIDGIAQRLPQDIFDRCAARGAHVYLVDSHKGLRLAG
jgi:hypothetical protein